MIPKTSFINPHHGGMLPSSKDANPASDKNWQTLIENWRTESYPLSVVTPVGTTSVYNSLGLFTVMGPLVFFSFQLEVPNLSGWNGSTYIILPITEALYRSVGPGGALGYSQYAFPVVSLNSGTVRAQGYLSPFWGVGVTSRSFMYFNTAYTNATGSTEMCGVSGWYYRSNA